MVADRLENHLRQTPARIGKAIDKACVNKGLELIERRRANRREEEFVVVLGYAHEHNTLAVPAGDKGEYKLVDPDGLLFEASYDLGILLRNWIESYVQAPAQFFS